MKSSSIFDFFQNALAGVGGVSPLFILGLLTLLILIAWKLPASTKSYSFFNSGFCLSVNIAITGVLVWLSTWAKLSQSTLGFITMLQYFSLAGATIFLVHSLCDSRNR
jgi:hypothetical protein